MFYGGRPPPSTDALHPSLATPRIAQHGFFTAGAACASGGSDSTMNDQKPTLNAVVVESIASRPSDTSPPSAATASALCKRTYRAASPSAPAADLSRSEASSAFASGVRAAA